MNHNVVTILNIYRYFAVFRGVIGNLNLPVVNLKKRISPRNTAKKLNDWTFIFSLGW